MINKTVEYDINLAALLGLRACMVRYNVDKQALARVWACGLKHVENVLSNTEPLSVAHIFLFCQHYGVATDVIYRFVPTSGEEETKVYNLTNIKRDVKTQRED